MDYKNFISGFIGGTISVWVGHPFDTLKVWSQKKNNINLKKIINNVKIRNLYLGWKYPLITEACFNGYLFGVNNIIKNKLGNTLSNDSIKNNFISGGLTGITYAFFVNPIELYKIRNQFKINFLGSICYKNPYRGILATIPRDIIGCSTFFGPYEYFKQQNIHPLISGGLTGIICWTTAYPFDVIKTRVQSDDTTSYKDAYQKGNLYKGLRFCLIRACLANSILFYTYELCIDLFD